MYILQHWNYHIRRCNLGIRTQQTIYYGIYRVFYKLAYHMVQRKTFTSLRIDICVRILRSAESYWSAPRCSLYLRSFGIKVNKPNIIYCDNRSVCSNVELANSFLKKRHIGIAYHLCREAVAAGIARISHLKTTHNRADILTKTLGSSLQYSHCDRIFPKANRDN